MNVAFGLGFVAALAVEAFAIVWLLRQWERFQKTTESYATIIKSSKSTTSSSDEASSSHAVPSNNHAAPSVQPSLAATSTSSTLVDQSQSPQPQLLPPRTPLETCSWLNVLLHQTFSQLIAKNLAKRWCDGLNKELAAQMGKTKLMNHCFASNVNLGRYPPEIKNIRILPSNPEKKDLELAAKFSYFGSCSMDIHTQLQLYSVIDAHLKVALRECTGTLLIVFPDYEESPPNQFDFTVSLAEEPFISLDIKSVVGTFNDMAMIKSIIQGTLKMILRSLLVEPNRRKFSWSPGTGFKSWPRVPVNAQQKKAQLAEKKRRKHVFVPAIGRLLLTGKHNGWYFPRVFRCWVVVQSAENLVAGDANGFSDPYCIVSFNRQSRRTKVINKTIAPVWDETFTFDVFNENDRIAISVYDRDLFRKDQYLGNCILPIDTSEHNKLKSCTIEITAQGKLSEKPSTVTFTYMFEPYNDKMYGESTIQYHKELDLSQFDDAFIEKMEAREDGDDSSSIVDLNPGSEASRYSLRNRFRKQASSDNVDSSSTTARSIGSPPKLGAESTSDSLLDLSFSDIRFRIVVCVVEARGLVPKDRSGFDDPYCIVHVGRHQKKTKVKKRTLSPIWQEELEFITTQVPKDIFVEVVHWNRFVSHVPIGVVKFGSPQPDENGNYPKNFTMISYPVLPRQGSTTSHRSEALGEIEIGVQVERMDLNHPLHPSRVAYGKKASIVSNMSMTSTETSPAREERIIFGGAGGTTDEEEMESPEVEMRPMSVTRESDSTNPMHEPSPAIAHFDLPMEDGNLHPAAEFASMEEKSLLLSGENFGSEEADGELGDRGITTLSQSASMEYGGQRAESAQERHHSLESGGRQEGHPREHSM